MCSRVFQTMQSLRNIPTKYVRTIFFQQTQALKQGGCRGDRSRDFFGFGHVDVSVRSFGVLAVFDANNTDAVAPPLCASPDRGKVASQIHVVETARCVRHIARLCQGFELCRHIDQQRNGHSSETQQAMPKDRKRDTVESSSAPLDEIGFQVWRDEMKI